MLELLLSGGSEAAPTAFTFDKIVCLALPEDSLVRVRDSRVNIIRGNVTCHEDVQALFKETPEGSVLIHTAGIIHPQRVSDLYAVNVQGTADLVETAAKCGVAKAVVISSNSPIGVSRDPSVVFDETTPFNPYMNYGRSKMMMEQRLAEIGRKESIGIVVLRPPWFYGTNQPARQSEFFRLIRDGKVPIVGDGHSKRSMAYLDNIAQAIFLSIVNPSADGETFWISDERPYEMNEIVSTIRSVLEDGFGIRCSSKVLRLPMVVGDIATGLDRALQAIGKYDQKIHVLSEMNKTIACSIRKAESVLNYHPTISLREGMRRSIEWVIQNRGSI